MCKGVIKIGLFDFLRNENTINEIPQIEERAFGTCSIDSLFNSQDIMLEDDVMRIPTVQAIIELISGTIAPLPLYLYKENEDGSIEKISGDYRERLLNDEPSEFQNAYNFKKNMVKDYLLYGANYSHIEREGNEIVSLYAFPSKYITVKKYKKRGYKIVDADIIYNESEEEPDVKFKPHEILFVLRDSVDGITSKGALHYGQNLFNLMASETSYKQSLYTNGALPLGILKTSGRLTQTVAEKLRLAWQNLYGGSNNAFKTVVLEEGLSYEPIALNPRDLMIEETNETNISDICRLFNIPESLVNPSANKYGSLEQNNIHFLQYTLTPILTAIEMGLNKNILLESEKEEGYFWQFDTSEVLKTTEKEKYEAINTALSSGVISLNEARYKLNYKSINDNIMKWSLGSVLYYPETGEMKIPNLGIGIEGYEGKGAEKQPEEAKEEVKDSVDSKIPPN